MRKRTRLAHSALLLLALAPGAAPARAAEGGVDAYLGEIESYRSERLERLLADDGWLTLAALHPLEPGTSRIGSDESCELLLPASAPGTVGTVTLTEGRPRFTAAEGVEVLSAGKPVVGPIELGTDAEGDPTVLDVGSVSFHAIRRGERFFLRVKDRQHPARASFGGLEHFPVDPAWRLEAHFEAYDPPKQIPIANVLGQLIDQPAWGAVVFEWEGRSWRLDALAEPGAESLFLIFADGTSGKETYGAGRYLSAPAPDETGRIELDFNRAYNPPCAFTAFATCPLPPRQNRLGLRVEAGEKSYRGEDH